MSERRELLGYTDPLVVHPGDDVRVMVSSEFESYESQVVRLIHGDSSPDGPGFKVEPVATSGDGRHAGRRQATHIGSYVEVPDAPAVADGFTVAAWIWPTAPEAPEPQALLSHYSSGADGSDSGGFDDAGDPARGPGGDGGSGSGRSGGSGSGGSGDGGAVPGGGFRPVSSGASGYSLCLAGDGGLSLRVGEASLSFGSPPRDRRWHFVAATFDAASSEARLTQQIVERGPARPQRAAGNLGPSANAIAAAGTPLLLAAGERIAGAAVGARYCFNGKLERPCLFDRALDDDELAALAAGADPTGITGSAAVWDFAATDAAGVAIADVSGSGHDGTALNYPMRGLTGHNWDATAFVREQAPEQYGAIHFHDDDCDDCRWEPDFSFTVPPDARSGYYAVHLTAPAPGGNNGNGIGANGEATVESAAGAAATGDDGSAAAATGDDAGEQDHIPFFVTPAPGAKRARAAYLAPTCSYLAYANERVLFSGGHDFSGLTNIPIVVDPYDSYLGAHVELGGSVYDVHTDGSGVCHSTTRRPILSMRATHRHWVTGAPRGYAFDLYLVDWLEAQGTDYDVITDEDVHFGGLDCLADYKVIMTGCHPEYWSGPMLDALEQYLDSGGRLMYLGGNGFYWATVYDPARRHLIEVRRGFAGSRAWESHPGETQFASTGEQCGIWRHLGRAPNAIVGTGFAAQGWDADTPGYRRLPDSFDPRAAWIFDGIGDDEIIGDFGLVMNGAAGDELDRVDHALGTPSHTLVLATSAGEHSRYYLVCHEDVFVMAANIDGTDNDNVRADMVFFETANDGAVFSVSSINWFSGLSHNNYDNNVSRVTANVLNRFLA